MKRIRSKIRAGSALDGVTNTSVGRRFVAYWRNHKLVLLLIVVVLIAFGMMGAYYLTYHSNSDSIKPYTADLPERYDQMNQEQVERRYLADTGNDIQKVRRKHFTNRTFKNFTEAYQTGQALNALRDYKKSQLAYAIAATKADDKTSYEFYANYTAVADMNNDKDTSKKMTELTKKTIQNDASLSDFRKKELIEIIDGKQRLKEFNEQ